MDNPKKILFAILILIAFLLGLIAGIFYQKFQESSKKNVQAVKTITGLSSKVVLSAVAYGEVVEISDRNITLNSSGDNLTIPIAVDAQIMSGTGSRKKISIEEIKKGDILSINMKVYPDGKLDGTMVFIVTAK